MRVVLTYRDYAALPADSKRYELHEGELFVTAAPGTPHQRLVLALVVVLREHVRARHLGEVFVSPIDCIMSDVTVLQPDIVFVGAERASVVRPRGIEGAPTLVVEVVSPSTASIDRGTKLQLYARYGVPFYWIVDADARRIEAHALEGSAYRLAATLEGAQAGALPPFAELVLDAGRLWTGDL